MKTETIVSMSPIHDDYTDYLTAVQARFSACCSDDRPLRPLFTTDAENLWETYLDSFADADERQHHNCHCCRHFIRKFGGLAIVGTGGQIESALWDVEAAPERYKPAVKQMVRAVRKAKITGVFLSADMVWGTPVTGVWTHFSVVQPSTRLFRGRVKTAEQAMAEKKEDYRTVMTALADFKLPHLETALRLLRSDALYRSEKVLGQAEWLYALQKTKVNRKNRVWEAVANAPAGFCHPRASMIGTLLEDIAAGKGYDQIARAFAAKMHPLSYQRPQAAPKEATIGQAEKIVEQLGIRRSLERRFARLDEVQALWRPVQVPPKEEGGVFSHLKPAEKAPQMVLPARHITWQKFSETVLPTAERMEVKAPGIGNYTCLVTAVHADAPPILQWDVEEARNPVSWYVWSGGSRAEQFRLKATSLYPVAAICLQPSMWSGDFAHQGEAVILLIEGAQETRKPSGALFPETLKAELHGVRKVIEAHSKSTTLAGFGEPHAAGLGHTKGVMWNTLVRVWSSGQFADYILDRWD
jgi:hypothetical protein